ncbi:MAG: hypothetical protein ABEN55_14675 [Bradymonadaceae bacterium]
MRDRPRFPEGADRVPGADVDLFGFGREPDFAFMNRMVQRRQSACLFVRDSGDENALA